MYNLEGRNEPDLKDTIRFSQPYLPFCLLNKIRRRRRSKTMHNLSCHLWAKFRDLCVTLERLDFFLVQMGGLSS